MNLFAQPSSRSRSHSGFTLIEILVTTAVIGVLIGISLPSLGKARRSAATVRELSAGQQLIVAYSLYADDSKSVLLPGYCPPEWVAQSAPAGAKTLNVVDDAGEPIFGVLAQRYPWRLAPYMEFNFAGLYKDANVLRQYRQRSDFQYVISLSPSFGLNSAYCGGDADRQGFNAIAARNFGSFYVTRIDQVIRPNRLLAFASCRGVNPDGGELVPGFFRADAPYTRVRVWLDVPPQSRPDAMTGQYGNLDYRHEGRAAVMHFDGHSDLQTFNSLNDMTRWSNIADRADWFIGSSN